MRETAYAKINLALHVRARRPDGYHQIETLFAFCEDGDELVLERSSGAEPELRVSGPFAEALGEAGDNLVLRAARLLMETRSPIDFIPRFLLDKRLPVAAGLGGGSADAAAAARLFAGVLGHFEEEELAVLLAPLGADIPACVASRTVLGTGTGTELAPVAGAGLQGLPVLLVNPGVAVATGPVFRAWDGVDRGPLTGAEPLDMALSGRNDLEAPAAALCPVIAEVLSRLSATGPLLARMSGSGATCFALYSSELERDEAAAWLRASRPCWRIMATRLRA